MSDKFYVIYQDDGFWTDFNEPTKGLRGVDWEEYPTMVDAMKAGYARAAYVRKNTLGYKVVVNGKERQYKTLDNAMRFFQKTEGAILYRNLAGEWKHIL